MLWDDRFLYIGAELVEPHVWGRVTQRDAVVYHDNDFEVFIDPDGDGRDYFEFEVNALNTVFDLLLRRSYRHGGPAVHAWDLAGLRTAVFVDGTLNEPRDVDRGWSVEMALPWDAMRAYATGEPLCGRPAPPRPGDTWRMNFSRVQWKHEIVDGQYRKMPNQPADNWVWSPQGEVDMHLPQKWGYVSFVGSE